MAGSQGVASASRLNDQHPGDNRIAVELLPCILALTPASACQHADAGRGAWGLRGS
ncbi:hypothetical protein VTI74DRAFT_2499 [Chaetomium olivicolor]